MHLCRLSIIIPLYFFLPLHLILAAGNSPALYYPLDDIAVNCGSSGSLTALDGRQWVGDIGSKYIIPQGSKGKLISSKAIDQPHSRNPVPFMTARISRWQFSYTFRVTTGQKFVRLHFYPTSYLGGFERFKAVFTVKAGPYTLLSNFSASLTADALGLQSFSKEFCVNVEENQPLTIMFSPALGFTSDEEVYAFVNGIEIVSVPTGLYHTPEGDPGAHVVGNKYPFSIDKSIALETVQRLNVGGSSILSIEDTGMFREWSEDSNYFVASSVLPVTTTIRIKYTTIPTYTAPQKVYQTSWSMVPNKQAKEAFNFTWKLPVDLGFKYLIRFHFCELEYEIKDSVHKEFNIIINNQKAEANASLIKWSGGNGVAVYRDYVVMMKGDRMEGKRDLLIALCPHGSHGDYEPADAILKGLEVFKLSNPDNNLAGANPVPSAEASTSSNPNRRRKLVFSCGGNTIATGVVILITIVNIIVYQLRILGEKKLDQTNTSSLPTEGLCRRFSLAELQSVTNNFDEESVIGSGGSGKVYKGVIDGGEIIVAIKRLSSMSRQGADEFWTEIEMVSKLRHRHLVSLIGYCNEYDEMILVYECMKNGTLADHLYKINSKGNGGTCYLSWEQRLKICIGAARGLDYLHTGTRHGVIHRDVKSTNILLDEDWKAKICDFGLCKMGTTSNSRSHVSTDVKGTFGFLDPEYFYTRRLTKKSDVYAFGVVLLEVLCGRPAVDIRLEEEQHSLTRWAQHCIKEEKLDQIIDPSLRDKISSHCLKVFVEVANKCLHDRPNGRPTMADVVSSLEFTLASQDRYMDSSAKENEETVNVGGADNEQIDENTHPNDALQNSTVPSPSTPMQYDENMPRGKKRSKGTLSRVFQTSIALLAKVGTSQITSNTKSSDKSSISGNNSRFSTVIGYPNGQILPIPNLRIFSFSELKNATRNFSPDRVLGEGGFGKVYKGWIDQKKTWKNSSGSEVAIKKLNSESLQGFEEWQSEVNFLGRLSHPNLVNLLGYCWEHKELLLVYTFSKKGSLENYLFGRGSAVQSLPWDIRLKILIGAARGLAFLHISEKQVIYRDFKASNILLDGSYNARISDFGLAKLGPSAGQSHVTTRVMGTCGYAAPEYIATGHLYVKSDVYGFGVVLFEMLTGLRALDVSRPKGKQNLVDWVKPYLSNRRKLKIIMDSRLEGKYTSKAALQIAELALKCVGDEPKTRPSMKEVVETLERIEADKEKPKGPIINSTHHPAQSRVQPLRPPPLPPLHPRHDGNQSYQLPQRAW